MTTPQAGQQELKEAIWKYTGQTVLLLAVFLAGTAAGWLIWGDALKVRAELADCKANVHSVRAERENANYEISRLKRENERLTRDLGTAKAAGAAEPTAATP